MQSQPFVPKSKQWSAVELFAPVRPEMIRLSREEKEEYQDFLWKDLCAEYDSFNLYQEIARRRDRLSPEFLAFADAWYRDETNHAQGFARIYELVYGERVESLYARLRARPADFSRMEELLEDEFKLCVLFAYDELATTLTYHKDVEFYRAFGPPQFVEWIRRLKVDEAAHFSNVIRVMMLRHRERAPEAEALMARILELDLSSEQYTATFVLDHSPDCVHFQLNADELSHQCAGAIVRKLNALTPGRQLQAPAPNKESAA